MPRQRGHTQTVQFTVSGGGAVTLAITRAEWDESVESIDVTGSTDNGVQALIAGYLQGTTQIEGVVDSSSLIHDVAPGVRAGNKGVLTITVGGATPFSIPIMVIRVRNSFAMKGAVVFVFDAGLDSLSGTYTRATE